MMAKPKRTALEWRDVWERVRRAAGYGPIQVGEHVVIPQSRDATYEESRTTGYYQSRLRALALADGATAWQHERPIIAQTVALCGQTLAWQCAFGQLIRLSESGARLGTSTLARRAVGWARPQGPLTHMLTLDDDSVLSQVHLESGQRRWKVRCGLDSPVAAPVEVDDLVLVLGETGSWEGPLRCVTQARSRVDGALVWTTTLPGWPDGCLPTPDGILLAHRPTLSLLDPATGRVQASFPDIEIDLWRAVTAPGVIVGPSGGGDLSVVCLDLTDGVCVRWRTPIDAKELTLQTLPGQVLVLVDTGHVLSLDLDDGREQWRHPLGAVHQGRGDLLVTDSHLVVAQGRAVSCLLRS